ncbi:MAG TPA: hypothetical protein VGM51_14895 [Armatimonadota bacterium]
MHRASLCAIAAVAAACLPVTLSPAYATIDVALNISNFVAGQASELSIDGVITERGTSTYINAATLMIRFDPEIVTLSGLPSGSTDWSPTAIRIEAEMESDITYSIRSS